MHASKLSFPAATVTTMPLFHALVTAVSIAMLAPPPSANVITLRLFCITAGAGDRHDSSQLPHPRDYQCERAVGQERARACTLMSARITNHEVGRNTELVRVRKVPGILLHSDCHVLSN